MSFPSVSPTSFVIWSSLASTPAASKTALISSAEPDWPPNLHRSSAVISLMVNSLDVERDQLGQQGSFQQIAMQ